MRRYSRLMALVTLVCALVAATAMTARGASQRRADIAVCSELLTLHQAEVAMDESDAAEIDREVKGNTRYCVYEGSSKAGIGHSIEIGWGPYSDLRKRILASPYKGYLAAPARTPADTLNSR